MIWENYVFRRGVEVEELWEQMFEARRKSNTPIRLLYVAGRGFDLRANIVIDKFLTRVLESGCEIAEANLILVGFSGYELSEELKAQTQTNVDTIASSFSRIGQCETLIIDEDPDDEEELTSSMALRRGADKILSHVSEQTDIVLDVSSLPRIAYLTILLALLAKVLSSDESSPDLYAKGITLQVLVGEDVPLDNQISSEDPSNDLVMIPGYSEALQSEASRDTPLVWFPILGENRLGQLRKVESVIPGDAEICPVLPQPSCDPRRGDRLLVEYAGSVSIPLGNIMYAHEAHPFEAYRQLLGAMLRYRKSLSMIGGCRIVVTPLASKLITIGSALACYEMKLCSADRRSSVAIPYAEPKRYVANVQALRDTRPEISALVLTGDAYQHPRECDGRDLVQESKPQLDGDTINVLPEH